jgi:hypothetical protein
MFILVCCVHRRHSQEVRSESGGLRTSGSLNRSSLKSVDDLLAAETVHVARK